MTDADLDELLKRWRDAGEDDRWEAGDGYVWSDDGDEVCEICRPVGNAAHLATANDRARFIAACRAAVPELIAALRAAHAERDAARAEVARLLKATTAYSPSIKGDMCLICGYPAHEHFSACPIAISLALAPAAATAPWCSHGINHSGQRHGCDGCCKQDAPTKEHCARRLAGEKLEPHAPCDTGDFSKDAPATPPKQEPPRDDLLASTVRLKDQIAAHRDEAERQRDVARKRADGAEMQLAAERRAHAATREALAKAIPFLELAATPDHGYGHCCVDDPRLFHPDPECSTEEERARHKADCEAWNRGERPSVPPVHEPMLNDNGEAVGHVTNGGYGLGSYVFADPAAGEALNAARAALHPAPAKGGKSK